MRALVLALAVIALLAACRHDRKPDLPGSTVVKPEAVLVERQVYVQIPASLTEPLPIAEGPIAQCFAVAADRRKQLEVANARFAEIEAIEGTRVPDGSE